MKKLLLITVTIAALAACGRSSEVADRWQDSSGILRFIPADSAAVAVRLEPLPAAFRDRFARQNTLLAKLRGDVWGEIETRDQPGADRQAATVFLRVVERLNELATPEGAAAAGIRVDGQMASYLVGSQPVVRMELADAARFEQYLTELEADIGLAFNDASLGVVAYRFVDIGRLRLAVVVEGAYVVATLVGANVAQAALPGLFGLEKPQKTMADTGQLADLAERHAIGEAQIAYLEPLRVYDAMLGAGGLVDQLVSAIAPASDVPEHRLSQACVEDLRRWPAAMPAVTLGYTTADETGVAGVVAVDLEPSMAKSLQGLEQPVPGLGVPNTAMLSMGFSLDVPVLRDFIEDRVQNILKQPFRCSELAGLNDGAKRLADLLERQTTPTFARDFRGLAVFLDASPAVSLSALTALQSARLGLVLAMKKPESLVALGNLVVPQIRALELEPDGEPVSLPAGLLNPTGQPVQVAMTDERLVAATGQDGEARLRDLLRLPTNAKAPVFDLQLDAEAYLTIIGGQMPEIGEDGALLLDTLRALYGRQSVAVRMTRKGLRLDFDLKLKKESK